MQQVKKVFYIDPMSYRNMAQYDVSLLGNIDNSYFVDFFCSNLIGDTDLPRNIIVDKVFNYNKKKNIILKTLSYYLSWFKILTKAIKKRPESIHIQWLRVVKIDKYIIYFFEKILNIRVVYTAHNIMPHNSGNKHIKDMCMIYKLSSKIIVHASRTKDELLDVFDVIDGKKISIIPHGILELDYKRETSKSSIIEKNKINYTIIGGISEYKGIIEFINLWYEVCERDTDFKMQCVLNILGKADSNYDCKIKEILSNLNQDVDIKYRNELLSDAEFNTEISNADIIVLPYTKISQSGVLLTAFSKYKPVFVSQVGGLDEVLNIASVGESFCWSDENNAQIKLITSFDKVKRGVYCNLNEWSKVDSYYSWAKIAQETESLY